MSQEKKDYVIYIMFASWINRQNVKNTRIVPAIYNFVGKKLIISRVQSELGTSVCISIKCSKGFFNKMLQMTVYFHGTQVSTNTQKSK